MDIASLIEAASKWGLGIVLSIVLVFIFSKFLSRVMKSYAEERAGYNKLIESQNTTINNHISHLENSVNEMNVGIGAQREILEQGFERVVDAIKSQTEILSNKISRDK